jgi:hypothetical protein
MIFFQFNASCLWCEDFFRGVCILAAADNWRVIENTLPIFWEKTVNNIEAEITP